MVIQCEQCKRRFRLDPSLIKHASVRVRCSFCQHVFRIDRPEVQAMPPTQEREIAPEEFEGPSPVRRTSRRSVLLVLIPVLGIAVGLALWQFLPSLLESGHETRRTGIEDLHLIETRGYFIDNKQAGQLFVIEGRVRNEFPTARRWIHLRAKLYTADGLATRELDFYAGNPPTTKQLKSLSLEDLLAQIQRRPAAREEGRVVAAQEEISFAVPFGNLPDLTRLSDYSVEILASQSV